MPEPKKRGNKSSTIKDRHVNKNFDSLPPETKDILRKAGAGLSFDNLNLTAPTNDQM